MDDARLEISGSKPNPRDANPWKGATREDIAREFRRSLESDGSTPRERIIDGERLFMAGDYGVRVARHYYVADPTARRFDVAAYVWIYKDGEGFRPEKIHKRVEFSEDLMLRPEEIEFAAVSSKVRLTTIWNPAGEIISLGYETNYGRAHFKVGYLRNDPRQIRTTATSKGAIIMYPEEDGFIRCAVEEAEKNVDIQEVPVRIDPEGIRTRLFNQDLLTDPLHTDPRVDASWLQTDLKKVLGFK